MSNKKTLLIYCPIASDSGYGAASRDLAYALIASNKYDIYISPCAWGTLSLLGLTNQSIEKNRILKQCVDKGIIENPDIFCTITIPNEFVQKGKIANIGFTAAVEVDRVSIEFLQETNKMSGLIVPSKHSANIFMKSSYTMFKDQEKTQPIGNVVMQKPVFVVFEGVDTSIYNNSDYVPIIDPATNKELRFETDFNFLSIGHWLPGGMNEDRKNVAKLIRLFLKTFIYNKNVGLILKTATGSNSLADRANVLKKIEEIKRHENINDEEAPPIYLIHGNLKEDELANLYKHPQIKAFVTLTHGEGYGRPIAEACACDLPMIATNWSGQIDFLDIRYSQLLGFILKPIPKSVVWPGVIIEGSTWAEVDEGEAIKSFQYTVHSYDEVKENAKKQGEIIRKNWNLNKMQVVLINSIEKILELSQQKVVSLPKQIKLPQLRKLK